MEKTPFSRFLESRIYGENLKVQNSLFSSPILHYSITPAVFFWGLGIVTEYHASKYESRAVILAFFELPK